MFMVSTRNVDASPVTLKALQKRRDDADRVVKQEADRLQRIADEKKRRAEEEKRQIEAEERKKAEKAEAARIAAEEKKQREIERCVNMLRAEALRDDRYIGKQILQAINAEHTLNSISRRVCLAFGVTLEEMQSRSRKQGVILARACFSSYAKTEGKRSYTQIARFLKRDHTTIIHAHHNYLKIKARAKAARDRKAKA